jgi:phage anti-repressor protein
VHVEYVPDEIKPNSDHDGGQETVFAEEAGLEIARSLDDLLTLAETLNRMSNWHLNMGSPFEALQDQHGLAQTLDFLGITHYVNGDLVKGTACYEQSLALFREMNDRQGMINSMTYLVVRSRFTTEVLE